MRKVMLDTNVVVDYLMGRQPGCTDAAQLIGMHARCELAVNVSALSLKDAFFIVSMQLKRMERLASGTLSENMAQAANEIAWSCVRQLIDNVLILPTGRAESLQALVFRSTHPDFEDNLIVATALNAEIDLLISNDELLVKHAPIACLSSTDAIALIESEREGL